MSNILQYEYTFHGDGIIWYDLSEVNGNPWDGNWEITASDGCTPRQAAYRYATDDAYGMQDCADSSTITVTICSGDGGSGAPPSESSPPAESSPVESATWASTATTASVPAASPTYWQGPPAEKVADAEKVPAPSGFKKEHIHRLGHVGNAGGATVTNVHTEYVTYYVTPSPAPSKRHEHHARHNA